MHKTVPETKIIQLKMSIAPRMENPVLENKGKRINSIHIRPLFESLDEDKGLQQKPLCVYTHIFGLAVQLVGSSFPDQGLNLGPQ